MDSVWSVSFDWFFRSYIEDLLEEDTENMVGSAMGMGENNGGAEVLIGNFDTNVVFSEPLPPLAVTNNGVDLNGQQHGDSNQKGKRRLYSAEMFIPLAYPSPSLKPMTSLLVIRKLTWLASWLATERISSRGLNII